MKKKWVCCSSLGFNGRWIWYWSMELIWSVHPTCSGSCYMEAAELFQLPFFLCSRKMIQCLSLSKHLTYKQSNKAFKLFKENLPWYKSWSCEVIKLFHCSNAESCFFSLSAAWGDGREFVLICDSRIIEGRRGGGCQWRVQQMHFLLSSGFLGRLCVKR